MRVSVILDQGRSSISITLSVWKALFLRESVHRLFSSRGAWAWLLLEPAVHVVFLMFMFSVVSLRVVGGIDTAVWIMLGLLAFFMFRRTGAQAMNAVASNQALFTYRQVKPVDTVLSRGALEGFLMLLVAILLCVGAGLVGLDVIPQNPLAVLEAFFGLWLFGLGFGLIASVAQELVPELGKSINLLMTPLYFLSGVMFPMHFVPPAFRDWLLLNPVAHGVEALRLGFAPHYQVVPELSIGYLYVSALIAIFLGLALHVRFSSRLATQ